MSDLTEFIQDHDVGEENEEEKEEETGFGKRSVNAAELKFSFRLVVNWFPADPLGPVDQHQSHHTDCNSWRARRFSEKGHLRRWPSYLHIWFQSVHQGTDSPNLCEMKEMLFTALKASTSTCVQA